MTTKKSLRTTALTELAQLDPLIKKHHDTAITDHLLQYIRSAQHHTIALYLAIEHEVSLERLIDNLTADNYALCAPRYNQQLKTYAFHFWDTSTAFEKGQFNILEPTGREVKPAEVDCILIPGICFSMDGARLGRGGGYYDRLCGNYTGERLGVCYESQKRTEIPVDAWDQKMDLLCTETGCLRCA